LRGAQLFYNVRLARLSLLPLFGLVFAFVASSRAEDVEVSLVRFATLRAPNQASDAWFEAEVVLNVAPPPASPGRMVNRVRVALSLGWELPGSANSPRRVEYYRAEAECVALEAGRADVRFYLPPELVKRDQLHGAPRFWTVDLAAGGRPLSAARTASSAPGALSKLL
jgi:hypothetical protein